MKLRNIFYITIMLAGASASASWLGKGLEKGLQWAGDRTGLKRPFEEVLLLAERKRTEAARAEAAAAEADANQAAVELQNNQVAFAQFQQEFDRFKAEVDAYKGKVRRLVTPVNAKIFELNSVSDAIAKSHQELFNDSVSINKQIAQLNEALEPVLASSSSSFMSDKDRAYVRILQIALQNKRETESFKNSLDLVSTRGRSLDAELKQTFQTAYEAASLGRSMNANSQSIHEELDGLARVISDTDLAIKKLWKSSSYIDQKVVK